VSRTILLVPTHPGVGLISVVWGLFRACENQGLKTGLFKPFAKSAERAAQWVYQSPMPIDEVEHYLSDGRRDDLLEELVTRFHAVTKGADVVVAQGLVATANRSYALELNRDLAFSLDADVILVTTPKNYSEQQCLESIEITARGFAQESRLLGYIVNKIGGPIDSNGETRLDLIGKEGTTTTSLPKTLIDTLDKRGYHLLGAIPWIPDLIAPRVSDVADFLGADVICKGEAESRRIAHITLCAQHVHNLVGIFESETLIMTPGDRVDVIVAAAMAAANGVRLAALLLTGGFPFSPEVKQLCAKAIAGGLPILSIESDSFRTALRLQNLNFQVPFDDALRLERVKNEIADHIETRWLEGIATKERPTHLSPAAFRYALVSKARSADTKIVLPEGNEPRIIEAASRCAEKGIAHCILLGNSEEIRRLAANLGLPLGKGVEIVDPASIAERYIDRFVELRRHKGVNEAIAKEQLADRVVVGTMMLEGGEVDGLVSGAVHSTAHTIRPALQLIKTAPTSSFVSSIFFMLLKEQVVVYGDCAVNPDPSAEQLAEIAITSAESAERFGIPARVAMISYSSGTSGSGADVEKVCAATALVREKRPDLCVDGPLQYDAASTPSVAATKAPESPVAGQATVYIFPDLNTGNTTYKAVQRSADVLSIGPMLQGLAKPVNDLSRGALVDDIVFTIALTAVQSIK
jgi:phosphate acetyltransferase